MLTRNSKTASSKRSMPDQKMRERQVRMCKLATYNALINKTHCAYDGSYHNQCKMSSCPHFQPTWKYKFVRRSILRRYEEE